MQAKISFVTNECIRAKPVQREARPGMCLLMAKHADPKDPVNFRIARSLLNAMDEWIERQRIKPGRSEVMATALREFLEREQHPARKPEKR
jgi:hypothetical protein